MEKRTTTSSSEEWEKFLEEYFEKFPLHKEVYSNFYYNGQISHVRYYAEPKSVSDESVKYEYSITDGIYIAKIISPLNGYIAYPAERNVDDELNNAIYGVCREQYENSPHKYHKCPENGVVLDFGCSEGIFPMMTCNSTNLVIGFDSDKSFIYPYLVACQFNGIEAKFIHTLVDKNIHLNEDILEGKRLVTVKMDIEGYELEGLIAIKDLIIKYKPQLQICTYHTNEQFKEILEYCINVLGYSNFTFNKNHMIFESNGEYPLTENFLRQTLLIANS